MTRRASSHGSFAFALVVLGALLPAGRASAQEGTDASTAEVLFNDGRRLMGERRFDEACPKLQESLKLDPGIGVALYLGECYAHAGKTASAWGAFREAAALARRTKDPREKVAQARATAMEPQLFKLTIVVPPKSRIKDLTITRDGIVVAEALWGSAVPIDPGAHVVVASAPGRNEWTRTMTVTPEGGSANVDIPLLAESTPASPPPVAAPPPPRPPPADPPPERPGSTQRTVGLGIAGLGVVGVAVGSVFGLSAMSKRDDIDAHCTGTKCDSQKAVDDRESARSAATASTIFFVAGGVLLAGGAALFFTAPTGSSKTAGSWGVFTSACSAGVRGTF